MSPPSSTLKVACLIFASSWLLAWLILWPWRRRQHVLPKHLLTFNGHNGCISEDRTLHNHCCENFVSYIILPTFPMLPLAIVCATNWRRSTQPASWEGSGGGFWKHYIYRRYTRCLRKRSQLTVELRHWNGYDASFTLRKWKHSTEYVEYV
jgi:hypothetical protein